MLLSLRSVISESTAPEDCSVTVRNEAADWGFNLLTWDLICWMFFYRISEHKSCWKQVCSLIIYHPHTILKAGCNICCNHDVITRDHDDDVRVKSMWRVSSKGEKREGNVEQGRRERDSVIWRAALALWWCHQQHCHKREE